MVVVVPEVLVVAEEVVVDFSVLCVVGDGCWLNGWHSKCCRSPGFPTSRLSDCAKM